MFLWHNWVSSLELNISLILVFMSDCKVIEYLPVNTGTTLYYKKLMYL